MQQSMSPDQDADWTVLLGFAGRLIYVFIKDGIRRRSP